MKFNEFKSLFTVLYEQKKAQKTFVSSLPLSIRDSFFDNEYTNSLQHTISYLLRKHLPEELVEEVDFFLYEEGYVDGVKVTELEDMLKIIEGDHEWL